MDLLKLIRENSEGLVGTPFETGLAAVIRHVARAETYLVRGRDEKDPDYFNDVIYRTNQAYEGILKEAYGLLANQDGRKLRTAELEKHFAKESILSPRVSDAFQKYRQDWRNPSTHDHRLSFTEQDAMLALSTISTFVYLLVDQMIETRSSRKQTERTTQGRNERAKKKLVGRKKSLGQTVAEVLMDHALSETIASFPRNTREVEIIGTIHGHLTAALPDVRIEQDRVLRGHGFQVRPDIVVHNGETVVIEVKQFKKIPGPNVLEGFAKIERYLETLGAREGILYLVPSKRQHDVVALAVLRQISNREVTLYVVTPSSAIKNFNEILAWPGWQPTSPLVD